jgi:hypothetical protein
MLSAARKPGRLLLSWPISVRWLYYFLETYFDDPGEYYCQQISQDPYSLLIEFSKLRKVAFHCNSLCEWEVVSSRPHPGTECGDVILGAERVLWGKSYYDSYEQPWKTFVWKIEHNVIEQGHYLKKIVESPRELELWEGHWKQLKWTLMSRSG